MGPWSASPELKRRSRALAAMMAGAALLGVAVALIASPPAARHRVTVAHGRSLDVIPQGGAGHWATVTLAGCSTAADPQVAFPQETPFRRTGPGAVVFASAPSCTPGSGSSGSVLAVAPVDARDVPSRPLVGPPADRVLFPIEPVATAATTAGRFVTVGASAAGGRGPARAVVVEGRADQPPPAPRPMPAAPSPLASATAYLGDVAIASAPQSGARGVQLSIEHHYQSSLPPPVALGGPAGAKRALGVALDYRTDALATWWQDGWLYARERHANGPLGPLQRFAKAGPGVQLTTLISDDGRAIVAWLDPHGHSGELRLDISAPGMRLGSGRLLERLHWRSGALPPQGAVRLVRLSTESVLMAWTGTQDGHFVVRAAGIDLEGVRTASTVSRPGEDAVLRALATGPVGDALAAWSATPLRAGKPAAGMTGAAESIMTARGVPSSRGVPRFGPPERVARAAGQGGVALAIDPGSDRALACWRDPAGPIRCAVRHVAGAR